MDPNQDPNQAAPQQGMLPPMSAPQSPSQVASAAPQGAPSGPPDQSTSFDVQQNPQDKQFMVDSMMYAPMLKNMTPEQRAEKWPGIVDKLSQVSPKAANILDPSLPPTDKDLEALTSRLPASTAPAAPSEADKAAADAKKNPSDISNQRYSGLSNSEFVLQATKNAMSSIGSAALNAAGSVAGAVGDAILPSAHAAYGTAEADPKYQGVKPGYKWKDPENKDLGVEPVPGYGDSRNGGPTKGNTGNLVMVEVAKNQLPLVQKGIWNPDGSVNRSNLFQANLPSWATGHYGSNNPDAQQIALGTEAVVQAATRTETGAAMPASEIDNTRKRYQPNATDTDEVIMQKYLNMKFFANRYIDLTITDSKDPNVVHFDNAKADAVEAQLQTKVLAYKKEWVEKTLKDPKNIAAGVTPEQVNNAWNQKVINDDKFLQKMGEEVQKDIHGKKAK